MKRFSQTSLSAFRQSTWSIIGVDAECRGGTSEERRVMTVHRTGCSLLIWLTVQSYIAKTAYVFLLIWSLFLFPATFCKTDLFSFLCKGRFAKLLLFGHGRLIAALPGATKDFSAAKQQKPTKSSWKNMKLTICLRPYITILYTVVLHIYI